MKSLSDLKLTRLRPAQHDWLDWDKQAMTGRFMAVPTREQIPENIKEQLIVELYSK